jgi:hypothetical protein
VQLFQLAPFIACHSLMLANKNRATEEMHRPWEKTISRSLRVRTQPERFKPRSLRQSQHDLRSIPL